MEKQLFELCKEVYEKTGWDDSSLSFYHNTVASTAPPNYEVVENREYYHVETPLYTSDYLLEKLPAHINRSALTIKLIEETTGYATSKKLYRVFYQTNDSVISDTPLKALLKLIVALHEAGELDQLQKTIDGKELQ